MPVINWQSGESSRSFLVPIVCKNGLSIAAATPNPSAPNDLHLLNPADITLKFWCDHEMQSAVCHIARPGTSLISQHSLPFFDDNCKRDSDDASKSITLGGIVAEMVLIRQIKPDQIDAGQ